MEEKEATKVGSLDFYLNWCTLEVKMYNNVAISSLCLVNDPLKHVTEDNVFNVFYTTSHHFKSLSLFLCVCKCLIAELILCVLMRSDESWRWADQQTDALVFSARLSLFFSNTIFSSGALSPSIHQIPFLPPQHLHLAPNFLLLRCPLTSPPPQSASPRCLNPLLPSFPSFL